MPPMNTSRTPPSPSPARLCTIPIVSPAGRPWRRLIYIHRLLPPPRRIYRPAEHPKNRDTPRVSSRYEKRQQHPCILAAISSDVVLFFRRYYDSGRRYVNNGRNRCVPGRATGIKPSIASAETGERARTKARLKPVYLRETRHSLRLAVTFLLSNAPAPLHMRRVAAAGATSADTTAAYRWRSWQA